VKIITLYPEQEKLDLRVYEDYTLKKQECIIFSGKEQPEAAADSIAIKDGFSKADFVVCPGGALKPLRRGVYKITQSLLKDAGNASLGNHQYDGVAFLCAALASKTGSVPCVVNPLSCDELLPLNRVSSLSNVLKKSRYFALQHAAMIDALAKRCGTLPEDLNVICVWLDDIVSVGAHEKTICIEVNDAIGGEGPMGLRSSGDIPVVQFVDKFFKSGQDFSTWEIKLTKQSGAVAYAGTDDPLELEKKARNGDKNVQLVLSAISYQTAKWIGICALALKGKVDSIIIAGRGTKSETMVNELTERVNGIAPVEIISDLDCPLYCAKMILLSGLSSNPLQDY
jgi:butyrate kinase